MIAIVYSGSRLADWRLIDKERILFGFQTTGMNPYIQDERFIAQVLNKSNQLINHAEKIKKIYFYGAGASSMERQEKIERVFQNFFINAKIKINHDIDASAIATLGNEKGIVGIIGSGSNAAYYTGKKVLKNNYGLGYALGDEGSTNWITRQLLKDFLVEFTPASIREKLTLQFSIDRKTILDKVYNSPNPNVFFNSFSDFIHENKENQYMNGLIRRGIETYFKTYIIPISKKHPDTSINFTGSVANMYQDILMEIAESHYLTVGTILKEPIKNLVEYHINKN